MSLALEVTVRWWWWLILGPWLWLTVAIAVGPIIGAWIRGPRNRGDK